METISNIKDKLMKSRASWGKEELEANPLLASVVVSDIYNWEDYFDKGYKNDAIIVNLDNIQDVETSPGKAIIKFRSIFKSMRRDEAVLISKDISRSLVDVDKIFFDKVGIKNHFLNKIGTDFGKIIMTDDFTYNKVLGLSTYLRTTSNDYSEAEKKNKIMLIYPVLELSNISTVGKDTNVTFDKLGEFTNIVPEIGDTEVCFFDSNDSLVFPGKVLEIEKNINPTITFEKDGLRMYKKFSDCFKNREIAIKYLQTILLNDGI